MTGWHHLYLGLFLFAIAIWLIADDGYQHWRQRTDPNYQSPLHRWYIKYLYRYEWVKKVNRWFDKLFNKNLKVPHDERFWP